MTRADALRVVFCWTEASGYMASCWRALAARPGIDLHILHVDTLSDRPNPFAVDHLLDGLSHEKFDRRRPEMQSFLLEAVAARRPDAIVLCGWLFWPYTRLVGAPELKQVGKIIGMDSPWRGALSQRLARWRLGSTLAGVDLVVTASERTAEYARRLGVEDRRLRSGFYGFDHSRFAAVGAERPTPWPRRFLFAGRYAPEKDLRTLLAAYEQYRGQVDDPWSLACVGSGSDQSMLAGRPGVEDLGFVQPGELPRVFRDHGAFVLPSVFEPWGVVLAEAAAAGLPIVCSSACGAAADVVRPYYNGVVFAPADVAGLARGLRWIHDHESKLTMVGARGQALAAAFSAEAWAERWHNYLLEATDARC